jgi:hypothetical protein
LGTLVVTLVSYMSEASDMLARAGTQPCRITDLSYHNEGVFVVSQATYESRR